MCRRNSIESPGSSRRLLRVWASRDRDEGYLGDLEEQYINILETEGAAGARRWYRREIIRALPRFIGESVRWRIEMLKNYLKIALRNLKRQRGFSFINILGLAAGMASCMLIFLYVSRERGYDRHHPDADRVFRASVVYESGASRDEFALDPLPLAPALIAEYPEVEIAARALKVFSEPLFEYGEKKFFEAGVFYADNDIFRVLSIPFIKGDSRTALVRPQTVVLTRRLARKYFGGEDPVGKAVKINGSRLLEVTGVVENPPSTTHLKYGWIVSLESIKERLKGEMDNWFGTACYTYLKLRPGADPRDLERRLSGLAESHLGPQMMKDLGSSCRFLLMPIADIHLNARARYEAEPSGNAAVLSLLSAAAGFILIIACLNFISLATARSARRAREVGLRKVVGAARPQLVLQFLGESVLIAFMSVVAAFLIALLARPAFNAIAGTAFDPGDLFGVRLLALGAGMALFAGLGAGLYPALILSTFRPAQTLKGSFSSKRLGVVTRKTLVIGQFLLASLLVVGTLVVFRQIRFMKAQDLGFSTDRMLEIPVRGIRDFSSRYRAVIAAFRRRSFVQGASASSAVPGRAFGNFNIRLMGGSTEDNWSMYHLYVDADFIPLYGMPMAAGRAFRNDVTADETRSDEQAPVFVVNEAAVRAFGLAAPEDALGRKIMTGNGGREGVIIGVVRDFHYFGLQKQVEPLVMEWNPAQFGVVTLKVAASNLREDLKLIEKDWNALFPGMPFESFFLDQDFDRQYQADERVLDIARAFTILGIFISCLGLFGLASYLAEQKIREIGIRKILGASTAGIVVLFSNGFIRMVVLANALAAPAAWFVMNRWLRDYAYRVKINPGDFLISAALSVAVALLTVGYQSIRAALSNPADSLRAE
jgi:putative ABC transport system permease protein